MIRTTYWKMGRQLAAMVSFMMLNGTCIAAKYSPGFGDVATNMMEPVNVFSDFVFSGCLIIGASFVFASLIKYVEHRRSPLMVPISTVIFLLIAGIVLILLPFTSYITDTGVHYSLFN